MPRLSALSSRPFNNIGIRPPSTYFIANLSSGANGRGVAVASSGNIYIVGNISVFMLIAKYNSSGTLQWQRSLGSVSLPEEGWAIAIDPSENVYITGYVDVVGQANNVIIAKYNTSGTIQWQKQLAGVGTRNDYGTSIAVDSASNVYVNAYSNASAGGGNFDFLTFKLDSSGNMSWQRSLSGSGGTSSDFGIGIALDSASNVYVAGVTYVSGVAVALLTKFPGDGTLTGTYSLGGFTYTYAASTLTPATSTLADNIGSLSGATSSLTLSDIALTDAAGTGTPTVITF